MTYATTSELLTRFAPAELAQRVDRGIPRLVTAELLSAAAAGASLGAYTPAEVERVQGCMAIIQRALQDADETINGYLNGRYVLPLSTTPMVLVRVACELARFYLYDDQVTDQIKGRHDASIKWLGEVSRGFVSLGVDSASGQPNSSANAELVSSEAVWKRTNSGGFL